MNVQTNSKTALARMPGISRLGIVIALTILLTACAGSKRNAPAPDAAVEGQQVDMTRPPNAISARQAEEVEGNPEETVSFEQWRGQDQIGNQSTDATVIEEVEQPQADEEE